MSKQPLHAVLLAQPMGASHLALAELAVLDAATRTGQVHVEVHAVNASARVILDAKVDMLGDSEAEAAVAREVLLPQLVLLDLQPLLQDLLCLLTADGHVAGDLLVAAHAPLTDRHASLGEDRLLLSELLQHLCCSCQAIAALAHTDVEHQLPVFASNCMSRNYVSWYLSQHKKHMKQGSFVNYRWFS